VWESSMMAKVIVKMIADAGAIRFAIAFPRVKQFKRWVLALLPCGSLFKNWFALFFLLLKIIFLFILLFRKWLL
jgi:hypothetical protein